MRRLAALLVAVTLVGTSVAPAAATEPGALPSDHASVMTGAVRGPALAPAGLTRVGTLTIRAIGLRVAVYQFSCRDHDIPNRALRWRCSGANNQFIFGHAYGVFHPYYLAWKHGDLKRGIRAVFTSPSGRVTRYTLRWARKVPSNYIWNGQTGEQWAWNATAVPSITLQTCWGPTNAYRIVTRFEKD